MSPGGSYVGFAAANAKGVALPLELSGLRPIGDMGERGVVAPLRPVMM